MKESSKSTPLSILVNILSIGGGILVLIGGAIAAVHYVDSIGQHVDHVDDRLGADEKTMSGFSDAIANITALASSAKNDAAATRAYDSFIVRHYGANPAALYNDPPATTSEPVTLNN